MATFPSPLVDKSKLMFFTPECQQAHKRRLAVIDSMIAPLTAQLADNVTGMSVQEQSQLRNQAWLLRRLKGLTGSVIGAVVGLNSWQTPYDLWLQYTMRKGLNYEENAAMEWGHRLEPVIAAKYAEATGSRLLEVPLCQSAEYPFLMGSLDRAVVDKYGQPVKVLEIKTASFNYDSGDTDDNGFALKSWGSGNKYDDNGELIKQDSQVPQQYLMQVMCYMIVTGLRQADIAVLMNTNTFKIFTIDFDEEIAQAMIMAADQFWCNNVLGDVAPVRKEVDVKAMVVTDKESSIEANDEVVAAVTELKSMQLDIKKLESREQELRDCILGFIGDNAKLTHAGKCLATYGMCKGRETFDTKTFQSEHPDQYQLYLKQGQPYRRFTLKK